MSADEYACDVCKDTGMTGWERPMHGSDGNLHLVFVPQICTCLAGQQLFARHQQCVFRQ